MRQETKIFAFWVFVSFIFFSGDLLSVALFFDFFRNIVNEHYKLYVVLLLLNYLGLIHFFHTKIARPNLTSIDRQRELIRKKNEN